MRWPALHSRVFSQVVIEPQCPAVVKQGTARFHVRADRHLHCTDGAVLETVSFVPRLSAAERICCMEMKCFLGHAWQLEGTW